MRALSAMALVPMQRPLPRRELQTASASPSPEAWLARRVALARSLALGSVSGWLLGLGERRPHRLLLDATASKGGEAVHGVGEHAIGVARL